MQTIRDILKELNKDEKMVFRIIYKNSPIARTEIKRQSKLKTTTLNRAIQKLEEYNLVMRIGTGESTGGRKPDVYDVVKDNNYIIGIDMTRTYCRIAIVNFGMEILYTNEFDFDPIFAPQKTMRKIAEIVEEGIEKLNINKSCILGIGFGTVGPVDREKGLLLGPKTFLGDTEGGIPIKKTLEDLLEIHVDIDIGCNFAAVGEYYIGHGKTYNKVAYISPSIAVWSGFVSNGIILRTTNDGEDAFGHMIIDVDGEKCFCGNYGCIECYSSIPAILSKFASEIKKGRKSIINKPIEEIDYKDICNAANAGDLLAIEVITSAATILGVGLTNYINLFNPDIVVMAGRLIRDSQLYFDVAVRVTTDKCKIVKKNNVIFKKDGYYGKDEIILGASVTMLEKYLE